MARHGVLMKLIAIEILLIQNGKTVMMLRALALVVLLAGKERPQEGAVEPQRAGLDWAGSCWILASDEEAALRAESPHIRHDAGVAQRLQLYHRVAALLLVALPYLDS